MLRRDLVVQARSLKVSNAFCIRGEGAVKWRAVSLSFQDNGMDVKLTQINGKGGG